MVHYSDKQTAHMEMRGAQRTASKEVAVSSKICIQSFIFTVCKSLRYISPSNPHSSHIIIHSKVTRHNFRALLHQN